MNIDLPLPAIRAMTLSGSRGVRTQLTRQQRQKLTAIATRLELPPRTIIYRSGDAADSVYINGGGVVTSYKELRSGRRRVAGFRFYSDLFGLAEDHKYVNTTRAVTGVTIYQFPVEVLAATLRQDAELEFQFLCKVVDELRQAQRKSIIVARRDATGRIAMFIDHLRDASGLAPTADAIEMPMSRSDMADYLNLALESVSRACAKLSRDGILAFDKRVVRILDHQRFAEIVSRA